MILDYMLKEVYHKNIVKLRHLGLCKMVVKSVDFLLLESVVNVHDLEV